jgi:hypothetical protein
VEDDDHNTQIDRGEQVETNGFGAPVARDEEASENDRRGETTHLKRA